MLGARPARFRRQRLLIVGCGDVGLRVLRLAPRGVRSFALTSTPARAPELRRAGATPLAGDLDHAASLRRLAGIAHRVLYLAPPPGQGPGDPRIRSLLLALRRRTAPTALVYGSTSGVYGDCAGALVAETRTPAPSTARAKRRLDAERRVRQFGRGAGVRSTILRIPGIYALNREGGTPRERLEKRTPALVPQDDVFTNHIHADDLARACLASLWRGRPQRVINVNDDTRLTMGEWFDLAADLFGLPKAPRITRAQAQTELSPALLSFMSESRRMTNTRMKRELRLALWYPTVVDGLKTTKLIAENHHWTRGEGHFLLQNDVKIER
ncbi:MAG: NAD-dependent epimerase/dehydratase family protein [Burkholderiales bacterium]